MTSSRGPARSEDAPGLPASVMSSVFQFLGPFVAGQGPESYLGPMLGTGSARSFVREVERSLNLSLNWTQGEASARDSLARQLNADQDLLVRVIDYALQHLTLGYDFQHAEEAAVELARALEQAGADCEVVPLDDAFGCQL